MALLDPFWDRQTWKRLNELLKSLQNQINGIGKETTNNETVQARVGTDGTQYDRLKNRLDEEFGKKANVTDMNNALSLKADLSYVDDQVQQSQRVIEDYNGSLADLNNDSSADINKNYLILDETDTENYGYVAKYDGSQFVRGWQFQSMGIADGSVTTEKANDNFMLRLPWLSDNSFDLDLVWKSGNYMLSGDVINNPFSTTAMLIVERAKTLNDTRLVWIKQTVTETSSSSETITKYRVIQIDEDANTITYKKEWKRTDNMIPDDHITYNMLSQDAKKKLFNDHKEELGYKIANMNWAQLEHNYSYTEGQFVYYTSENGIEYRSSSTLKYSDPIPVQPGEVWKISTRSTDVTNWSVDARGIFLDENDQFVGFVPVDGNVASSGISTFKIPDGVTKMIINARIHTSNQNQTHIMKLHDFENVWDSSIGYTLDSYIDNSGNIVSSSSNLAVTNSIPVVENEIYRIANVHSGDGVDFDVRGVFLNEFDEVVSPIPNPAGAMPYTWNDVIVPTGATKMRVNFYYDIATRTDTTESISINKAITASVEYSNELNKLQDKVWGAYGDSTTWYADWTRLVENATGLSVYNNGHSGASMSSQNDPNSLCNDTNIDNLLSSNPDVITILSGLNSGNTLIGDEEDLRVDLGQEDKSTFIGAYAYLIKRIFTENPSIKIFILTTTFSNGNYNNDGGYASTGLTSLDFARASKTVAEYFGIPIIDVRHTMQLNWYTQNNLSSDNVHISMRGAEAIASTVIRELKNINWTSKW